jgi:hypothetical protein
MILIDPSHLPKGFSDNDTISSCGRDNVGLKDVELFRSHVAQLAQQQALQTSEEEAKKKGWWQFWK